MLDGPDHGVAADVLAGILDQRIADADVEQVGDQFLPGKPPAVVARVHPFEAIKQRLKTDPDADRGRGLGDGIGCAEPEGHQRDQHCRLKPSEDELFHRAALYARDVFPANRDRRLRADQPLAYANSVHITRPRNTRPPTSVILNFDMVIPNLCGCPFPLCALQK
jgi:hypothetical protein